METSACFIRMINMMYTCVSANFIFVGKNTKNQIKGCAPGNIAVCGFCLGWNCTLYVKRNSFTSKSKTRSADRHWPQNLLIVVPYQEIYVVRKGHVVLFREYSAVKFVLGN